MSSVSNFIGDTVGGLVGGITGASQAAEGAQAAAGTQAASAEAGIQEQRRQFDKIVELMSPYVGAGTGALGQQQALLGLTGAGAQQQAISGIEQSPQFLEMVRQGENALLQNASATGGLRGGNVQSALAQYRPQILSDLINQQYGRLGGLSQMGQAAAGGQASAGQSMASNVGNLLGQQGAAMAGGQLAASQVPSQAFGSLAQGAGMFYGMGGMPGISKLF